LPGLERHVASTHGVATAYAGATGPGIGVRVLDSSSAAIGGSTIARPGTRRPGQNRGPIRPLHPQPQRLPFQTMSIATPPRCPPPGASGRRRAFATACDATD
jgi:hypothetical protein